ncbi:MAG TPA: hypothetical protein VGH45_02210 [Solirubrobacteraceae bacterium]
MYVARVVRSTGREIRAVIRAATPAHSQLRDRIMVVALATVGIDVICAGLALLFEHDVPRTEIKSYGSALFWTSTQLLTVSSQLPNPFSLPGRILDIAMEAYAITVVATLAASIGAFMIKRGREAERAAARGNAPAGGG